MGDTSIGLLDDCLTSLHTKQLQQRNKWRDAASRGGGQRRPAADEYSPPRKDLLRRPAGESLSPKPAPPAGAPPPKTVGRDTPSPVLAARAAKARGYRYSLDDDEPLAAVKGPRERRMKRVSRDRRPADVVVAPAPVVAAPAARRARPAPKAPKPALPRGPPKADASSQRRPSLNFRPAPPPGEPSPPKVHAPRGPPKHSPLPEDKLPPSPARPVQGASLDFGSFDADKGGGLFDAAPPQPKARRTRDARVNPLSETGPRQLPDLARPGPPEQPPEVARALARHRRPPPPSEEAQLLGPDGRPLRPKKESLPPPSKSPTASGGSTPTNASKEDPLAQKVAGVERDFSKAVDAWLAQNSDTTPDARERFADHLTQQYMCSVLDALPSTDAVRSVRRRVAAKIELVAAGVREPAPSPPKKRTAPWHCPACGRTNEPALSNCAVCQRSAPDGPAVDPKLVASIGAMKARSDVKANEIQGLMGDTEAFLKKLRDSRT